MIRICVRCGKKYTCAPGSEAEKDGLCGVCFRFGETTAIQTRIKIANNFNQSKEVQRQPTAASQPLLSAPDKIARAKYEERPLTYYTDLLTKVDFSDCATLEDVKKKFPDRDSAYLRKLIHLKGLKISEYGILEESGEKKVVPSSIPSSAETQQPQAVCSDDARFFDKLIEECRDCVHEWVGGDADEFHLPGLDGECEACSVRYEWREALRSKEYIKERFELSCTDFKLRPNLGTSAFETPEKSERRHALHERYLSLLTIDDNIKAFCNNYALKEQGIQRETSIPPLQNDDQTSQKQSSSNAASSQSLIDDYRLPWDLKELPRMRVEEPRRLEESEHEESEEETPEWAITDEFHQDKDVRTPGSRARRWHTWGEGGEERIFSLFEIERETEGYCEECTNYGSLLYVDGLFICENCRLMLRK